MLKVESWREQCYGNIALGNCFGLRKDVDLTSLNRHIVWKERMNIQLLNTSERFDKISYLYFDVRQLLR